MTLPKTCWLVSDGKIGMKNEALGLAEAIPVPHVLKRVAPRPPWCWLPAWLQVAPLASLGPDSDALAPPWPDMIIACGRQSVAVTVAIKRLNPATFTVYLQHPRVPISWFDLVVPPRHDELAGPNVIETRGAIHRVTRDKIAAGAARLAPIVAHLPRPLVAVLIGGPSREYRFDTRVAARIGDQLVKLARDHGCGLMITASRRTGAASEKILRDKLATVPSWFWDGAGDNPYFGMLGLADFIVATVDSIAMTSEACSTGKPVYSMPLEGSRPKFELFHGGLREDGLTRLFDGKLERWTYEPLDDTGRVAAAIRRMFDATHPGT
ncbi:MAG: hypothetical protein FJX47_00735 [Alphaproteobacteria bacterium]|nr:hypothetical protein [Alphaproteobacteria bacterium]